MDDEIEEDEPLSLGDWVMVYFFGFLPACAVIVGLIFLYFFAGFCMILQGFSSHKKNNRQSWKIMENPGKI